MFFYYVIVSLMIRWSHLSHWPWNIKNTTDTASSASYLDIHLDIDNEKRSTLTHKEIISIFPLWTFYLCVAAFQSHLHMKYISLSVDSIFQNSYPDFPYRGLLLSRKLLNQGFPLIKLKSSPGESPTWLG